MSVSTQPHGDIPPLPRTVGEGRYELREKLGEGGMGVVWKAYDTQLGRIAAIKELSDEAAGGEQLEKRIRRMDREAKRQAQAGGRGSFVVQIYDHFSEGGRPWIVMEYIDGPSLGDILKGKGPQQANQVVRLGWCIAEALTAVHGSGFMHRDVKPGNILISQNGDAWLSDFGIARAVQESQHITKTGAIVCTQEYAAPEVFAGTPEQASDMWSLGVVLYEATEGRLPFGSGLEVFYRLADAKFRPEPPRNAGPLGDVISELLNRDSAQRPTAAQVAMKLSCINEADAGPAEADRNTVNLKKGRVQPKLLTRRQTAWGAGVATALALVALAVFTLLPSGYEPPADWGMRQGSDIAGDVAISLAVPKNYSQERKSDPNGYPEVYYVSPDGRFHIKVMRGPSKFGEPAIDLADEALTWYKGGGLDKSEKSTVGNAERVSRKPLTVDRRDAAMVEIKYSDKGSSGAHEIINLYVTNREGIYYRVQVWVKDQADVAEGQRLYSEVQKSIEVENF